MTLLVGKTPFKRMDRIDDFAPFLHGFVNLQQRRKFPNADRDCVGVAGSKERTRFVASLKADFLPLPQSLSHIQEPIDEFLNLCSGLSFFGLCLSQPVKYVFGHHLPLFDVGRAV
jgi:hypothetical protein